MEEDYKIYRKIEPNKKIRVFTQTYAGKKFNKIKVTQNNFDNSKMEFYISVIFKRGVELPNLDGKGTDIIIKKAYENFRPNPKDEYNPIPYLLITDFDIVGSQKLAEHEARYKFEKHLYENEVGDNEVYIDDNFLD